jgi:large subunit ribosomal protein L4
MTKENANLVALTLPVKRLDGSKTGDSVELNPDVFGLPRNDHVMYLAVKVELSNRRQGTHATKTRDEVSGGGRKPWKQKGRGNARAGSNRSPVWRGGGIMHGPQPHDHLLKLPTQVRRLARKTALSVKAQSGNLEILEDFDFATPKTKLIASALSAFNVNAQSTLFLVNGYLPGVVKSCRNIPRVEIRDGVTASTYDILRARKVFISRSALSSLVEGFAHE